MGSSTTAVALTRSDQSLAEDPFMQSPGGLQAFYNTVRHWFQGEQVLRESRQSETKRRKKGTRGTRAGYVGMKENLQKAARPIVRTEISVPDLNRWYFKQLPSARNAKCTGMGSSTTAVALTRSDQSLAEDPFMQSPGGLQAFYKALVPKQTHPSQMQTLAISTVIASSLPLHHNASPLSVQRRSLHLSVDGFFPSAAVTTTAIPTVVSLFQVAVTGSSMGSDENPRHLAVSSSIPEASCEEEEFASFASLSPADRITNGDIPWERTRTTFRLLRFRFLVDRRVTLLMSSLFDLMVLTGPRALSISQQQNNVVSHFEMFPASSGYLYPKRILALRAIYSTPDGPNQILA
ncbi:hypothetical protein C8R43DRAFT_951461 [Mycena crocata]|nr:hypothetical protein C8R43DRAFT_951461 [Mycena crocata]